MWCCVYYQKCVVLISKCVPWLDKVWKHHSCQNITIFGHNNIWKAWENTPQNAEICKQNAISVKTMSNSGQLSGYSGCIAATAQLWTSAHHSGPGCAHTLPLSATLCIRLNPVVSTLPCLPCCSVSSPYSIYIFYLVVFSLGLAYFHWTWPSPNSGRSDVYLSP